MSCVVPNTLEAEEGGSWLTSKQKYLVWQHTHWSSRTSEAETTGLCEFGQSEFYNESRDKIPRAHVIPWGLDNIVETPCGKT